MFHSPLGAGFVLCVGLPLQEVTRIARTVHDSAVVLATNDVAAARALLAPAEKVEDDEPPDSVGVGGPVSPGVHDEPTRPVVVATRTEIVTAGPLAIDLAGREVTVDTTTLHLSAREFDLLALLASDVGRVWSFAALTEGVWGTDYLGDREQLTSTVKRLRKRLALASGCEVRSVHGVGYRLRVPGG